MRCHTTRAIFAQCRALSSNGHGASRNRARHCSPRLHIACDFIQGGRTGHARTVSRRGCAPELCMDHPHGRQRAQGRLGAGRTHGPPATKKAGGSHHRFGRTFGLPCAMVLTVSFALSLGTGLSCPHRRADRIRATWHQRRDARTTRLRHPRLSHSSAQQLRADTIASIASRAQRP
jgi:hypothetical protein